MQPISQQLLQIVRAQHLDGNLLDDGSLQYVVFLRPVLMSPIVRTAEEAITATIARQAHAYDVVINGNYFGLTRWGSTQALFGHADKASDTEIQGKVIANGRQIAGDSRSERFYIAEVMSHVKRSPYRFEVGRGDPPVNANTVAALGNVGPMVVHGLPYGVGNQYRPPARGPAVGDPGPRLSPSLTQRNDNTFASVEQRDSRTGKTIIAWHARGQALLVGVEKDHDQNRPGETYTRLTQLLSAAGFTEAVFLDGSDSAMLWYKGRMTIAPGDRKANTMTVGLGFREQAAPAPAPKAKKR